MRKVMCALLLLTGFTTKLTPKPVNVEPPLGDFRRPSIQSIVVVMLENKDERDARKQPFLGRLVERGTYFTNYYGVAHPSQPNYIAMISGSTDGVRGDSVARLERPHLGQQVSSWMVYAEGYPADSCDLRPTIGRYARKHVPFLSFADVQDNKEYCRNHITNLDGFLLDAHNHTLPQFSLVIPNMDHDAHDQPLSRADEWLARIFEPLLADPAFFRDVLLIITFDEDDANWPYLRNRRNNHIYMVFFGESVIPGTVKTSYDHYDLLRTIEEILHVQPMGTGDANATVIGGIWR